tara:strand:+ start:620 stop:853 length:234 start_codon:yes stop_codon:yes gene_type:complete
MNAELKELYRRYNEPGMSLNERIAFWENPDNLEIARRYNINYVNLYKAEIETFNRLGGDGLDGRTKSTWPEKDLTKL